MPIQIDIPMPKSCRAQYPDKPCPFSHWMNGSICILDLKQHIPAEPEFNFKPEWCPLKEVE